LIYTIIYFYFFHNRNLIIGADKNGVKSHEASKNNIDVLIANIKETQKLKQKSQSSILAIS